MDTQKENPLRGPWTYVDDAGWVLDCDGRVVAELTKRSSKDVRGRAVLIAPSLVMHLQLLVDWYGKRAGGNGLLGEDDLLPPEQQSHEIAAAMNLLATLEVKS